MAEMGYVDLNTIQRGPDRQPSLRGIDANAPKPIRVYQCYAAYNPHLKLLDEAIWSVAQQCIRSGKCACRRASTHAGVKTAVTKHADRR